MKNPKQLRILIFSRSFSAAGGSQGFGVVWEITP
jgi:hypothetical protein